MKEQETQDQEAPLEIVSGDALAHIEKAQFDMQIATAKKYPRSIKAFLDEAQSMIALNEETAEGCNYKLKRQGKDGGITWIEGPSVRLLEIAASAYTNLRYGSRVIGLDEDFVTAQGIAFDLQKNVASTVEVKRSIKTRKGMRYSQDMIMVTANAAGSIARRNALNGIVPRAYITQLGDYAKRIALGDIKSLPERRQRAVDYFTKTLGVEVKRVLEYLEKASLDDCDLADVEKLQGLKTALKEGDLTVDEAFKPAPAEHGGKPSLDPKKEPEDNIPFDEPKAEEQKPKPTPAERAARRHRVPTPEPAAAPPPEPTPPTPAEMAAATSAVTPQQDLWSFLSGAGVSFDDFRGWLESTGRVRDVSAFGNIDDLPADFCQKLIKDASALAKCVRLFGHDNSSINKG